ncbi:hypothetical protein DCS_05931 [Drechmeria coniospora]|uniref:Major facilitator superfamily (MFS) profile domain-containing protein n=1 Tax=Drechmeria coniospora TaxID=98403 RepID=A0A151GA65_DRECN|nr:hypothetical protein DCS_05931 [Drechmeria coniospora]KYK53982.1 hypothetical protein DCS_05931 [Drechmeria coniospora]
MDEKSPYATGSDAASGEARECAPPPPPPTETLPSSQSPPPDGGLVAWLHVLGGFMLFFNSWGLLNTFGVYQTHYESGAMFRRSSSDISWIGAVQAYLVFMVGLFAGPIYDRGYFKALIIFGSFAITFGHMMLSLCAAYWQVLLAQGFVVGIGAGCLFVPCASIMPTYFRARLGLAMGLASAGSSFGGVIYPIVLSRLMERLGFAWAVRVIGFVALGTLAVPVAVMRMRFKAPKVRSLLDASALTDRPYLLFVVATLVGFVGLNVAIFYISFYPFNLGLADKNLSFYMVAVFNAASTLGRIVPNAVSDKVGPFNIIAPCAVLSGVVLFCMTAVRTLADDIVLTLLVGFFSGVFIAMPPVCFAALTPDRSKLGTRVGMGFGIVIAVSMLIGGPVGGAVLGTTEPLNWTGCWVYAGAFTMVSGFMYAAIRVMRSGYGLMVKG